MTYRVSIDPGALREIAKLPKPQQKRIVSRIDILADNPRPQGAEKMIGMEAYRLRVGDYRVIYSIRDEVLVVLVVRIAHRREVYKDLDVIRKRLKK